MDALQALLLNVFHARAQAGDAKHIGRAAFEEVRELLRLRLARGIAARAAFAPSSERGTRPDVQRPGARGTEQGLMAGKRQEVDIESLHVNGNDAGSLSSVNNVKNAALQGNP